MEKDTGTPPAKTKQKQKQQNKKKQAFVPPAKWERVAAVALPRLQAAKDEKSRLLGAYLKDALEDEVAFRPIPVPKPGWWLSENQERAQPVKLYCKSGFKKAQSASKLNVPGAVARDTIYLIPLGNFDLNKSPAVEELMLFGEAYLCMKMQLLPSLELRPSAKNPHDHFQVDFPSDLHIRNPAAARQQEIRWRNHFEHKKRKQLFTRDIHALLNYLLPPDGFCVIGLVMEDLFPTDRPQSYLCGEADSSNRTGIFSFSRFHPDFFSDEEPLRYLNQTEQAVMLRRSCKLMAHELIHLFGLSHCIHFSCVMNGTRGLEEGATKPTNLCPVCLHKVFIFRESAEEGFDVRERYLRLYEFYQEHTDGFARELAWTATELQRLDACQPRQRKSAGTSSKPSASITTSTPTHETTSVGTHAKKEDEKEEEEEERDDGEEEREDEP